MNEGNILRIDKPYFRAVLRIITLMTFFICSCSMVQSVLMFLKYYEQKNLSMLVVFLFLMVSPLTFLASLFFVYGIHRMAGGTGADLAIVLGYAMLVLTAVDDLVYISVQEGGDIISLYLLGGIRLTCYMICFLYYQDYVNGPLAFCACVLLAACAILDITDLVQYMNTVTTIELPDMYYMVKCIVTALISAEGILFLVGIHKGIRTRIKK